MTTNADVIPTAPSADTLLSALVASDFTHVVGLPDNASAALYARLEGSPLAAVGVTREGEAFAVASGLWLGGRRPVVVIQNTGLLESGDGLRGTAVRMGVPLLCVVTYRGYARSREAGFDPSDRHPAPDAWRRPDVDTAALATEPTLRAWNVPFWRYQTDADTPLVGTAAERAHRECRPTALLLTGSLA